MHSNLVLDAGAFYAGTMFMSSSEKMYTTSQVLEEVRHIKSRLSALEVLRESGRLLVQDPDQDLTNEWPVDPVGVDITIPSILCLISSPMSLIDIAGVRVRLTLVINMSFNAGGNAVLSEYAWIRMRES